MKGRRCTVGLSVAWVRAPLWVLTSGQAGQTAHARVGRVDAHSAHPAGSGSYQPPPEAGAEGLHHLDKRHPPRVPGTTLSAPKASALAY